MYSTKEIVINKHIGLLLQDKTITSNVGYGGLFTLINN